MQRNRKIISLALALVMVFACTFASFGGLRANAAAAKSYTVTFVDWDDTTITSQSVARGKNATPPADPVREGYTFDGWDGTYKKVTADSTVKATYVENEFAVADTYTVTFKDWDGTVLAEETVEGGTSAAAPEDPTREGHDFTGWAGNYVWVYADEEVVAQYEAHTFTVTFVDFDDSVIDTQTVAYGKAAKAPEDPERTYYTFKGWDVAFDNVTKDITVKAQYEVNRTVTYKLVEDVTKLSEDKEYVVVAWRYFAGTNSDSYNGYILKNDMTGAMRAPSADNYATITYADETVPDSGMWNIAYTDGKITLKNVENGKYLTDSLSFSDTAYKFTLASGKVNGVNNYAFGTSSKCMRFSGTSGKFSLTSSSPSSQVTGTNACNILFYEKVGDQLLPDPVITITSDDTVVKGEDYIAEFTIEDAAYGAEVTAELADGTELEVTDNGDGTYSAVVPADVYADDPYFTFTVTINNEGVDYSESATVVVEETETKYIAVRDLTTLSEKNEYLVVAWHYFGGTHENTFNGFIMNNNMWSNVEGSASGTALRAPTADKYETVTYAGTGDVPDSAKWNIGYVDGKITIKNVANGKYLTDALGYSDTAYKFTVASGKCNGYDNICIGTSGKTIRYSNSGFKFSMTSSAPSSQVTTANACNIILYQKVEVTKRLEPTIEFTSADEVENTSAYTAAFTVDDTIPGFTVAADCDGTALEVVKGEDGSYTAVVDKKLYPDDADTIDITVTVVSGGETYTETLTVKVKDVNATTYEAITGFSDINADDEYVVVAWRNFGTLSGDGINGFIFSNDVTDNTLRAPTEDEYAHILFADNGGEVPENALWKLAYADGKITMQNVATGKYVSTTLGESDTAVQLVAASGTCNGYADYAIGTASGAIRYSGTSGTFVMSTTAPATEAGRAYAANITIYKRVGAKKLDKAQVMFASDFQGDSSLTNLPLFMQAISADGKLPALFVHQGDIVDGSVYEDGADVDAAQHDPRAEILLGAVEETFPGIDHILMQGNHDSKKNIESGTIGSIKKSGPVENDDYIVYTLNEDDFPWWQGGYSTYSDTAACKTAVQNTANALKTYLNGLIAAGNKKPVFICTHVPMHWSDRSTNSTSWYVDNIYANILFDVVNEAALKQDIVFLFGHNHSGSYDNAIGGTINFVEKGSELKIPNGTNGTRNYTTETINFTYMNAGYMGNKSSGLNPSDSSMSVLTVTDDSILVDRYGINGKLTDYCKVIPRSVGADRIILVTSSTKVAREDDYTITFTVTDDASENYTVTAKVNGSDVALTLKDGVYTATVPATAYADDSVKALDFVITLADEFATVEKNFSVDIKDPYTVTFQNPDGEVLKEEKVKDGGNATAPTNPQYNGYLFTGWDKSFTNVTSDLVVTAQYFIYVVRDDNIAPLASSISAPNCSSWENPKAINDKKISDTSYEPDGSVHAHYGSWGNNVQTDTITYTWDDFYYIDGCGIEFWYDDNQGSGQYNKSGIDFPTSYTYSYLDPSTNQYVAVPNPSGYPIVEDAVNATNFDRVLTKSIRITMNKASRSDYGLGVTEWEVYGEKSNYIPKPSTTANTDPAYSLPNEPTLPEDTTFVNIAPQAFPESQFTSDIFGGDAALNDDSTPATSANDYDESDVTTYAWTNYGTYSDDIDVTYVWNKFAYIDGVKVYFMDNGDTIKAPKSCTVSYLDTTGVWRELGTIGTDLNQFNELIPAEGVWASQLRLTMIPDGDVTSVAEGIKEWQVSGYVSDISTPLTSGVLNLENSYLKIATGDLGQLTSLKIVKDEFDTEYIINSKNTNGQSSAAGHQWFGELMFKVKVGGASSWSEQNTGRCTDGRTFFIEKDNASEHSDKYIVEYANASAVKGINKFKLQETYQLIEKQLIWTMTVTNNNSQNLTIGDWGVPLAWNNYWSGDIYEERVIEHSFVGLNSSYVYAQRPSGLGPFLVLTPEATTGAKFEYQDYWMTNERANDEKAWCQDQSGWAAGLQVYYIHSDVIKSTNRGYLGNTSLTLAPGESKTYEFRVTLVEDHDDLKTVLYNEDMIDAVAVPGMAYSVDMPGKVYLHTTADPSTISFDIDCPHEAKLYDNQTSSVCTYMDHTKTDANTYATFDKTVTYNGEQYIVYDLHFNELGHHNVYVTYDGGKKICLQFYMMDDVNDALNLHADFMVNHTQINDSSVGNKAFDDWMMDNKTVRANVEAGYYWTQTYWGWGDDWALTHGTFLAEKNVYTPVASQIEALDDYLTVCIWGSLMNGHHSDYKINDFLVESYVQSGANTLCYRGYAYPHIYNTYFAMYKIASRYPSLITYDETPTSYLLKAYNICKALYGNDVSYNWSTGVMGEQTNPEIIAYLKKEGYVSEAATLENYFARKYNNFKSQTYPYGSEYNYDNTGEEAVYTLAKMQNDAGNDTTNARRIMKACDLKTRACRGLQPVWYHYAVPTTICGEGWWNFQYTVALAGYIMDDYLRLQDNGWSDVERAILERDNYAAKIASITVINSGQIDAQPENIGASAWTYTCRLGNTGAGGTGGGKQHNGWRQMTGESDLNLWGAMRYLSSDVSDDPVFGLFGYGCEVSYADGNYTVTPIDGLYIRLNFINTKLSIELKRDQYTQAIVADDNTRVELAMRNIESTAHTSDIEIAGLEAGTYTLSVNGTAQRTVTVGSGIATFPVDLPAAASCNVVISK